MLSTVQPLELQPWQRSFYSGDRLLAEIQLLASAFSGDISERQLTDGCALLQASFGAPHALDVLSPFQEFQAGLIEPQKPADSRNQYIAAAECPDALMLWALIRHLTAQPWQCPPSSCLLGLPAIEAARA